jgi:hypothetical protein
MENIIEGKSGKGRKKRLAIIVGKRGGTPVDEWTEDEEEDTNLQQEGNRSPNTDSGDDEEDDGKLH